MHYMIPRQCSYFCCCACFGIKKYQCIYQIWLIHQLFHKISSINIILKAIMGHNSVEKFRKIMCTSQNMDHISKHKQIFIKIHSLFLKILRKVEILTSIKGRNSVENFRKISCVSHDTAYTKFHQNPSTCFQDITWKQNSDINQGP